MLVGALAIIAACAPGGGSGPDRPVPASRDAAGTADQVFATGSNSSGQLGSPGVLRADEPAKVLGVDGAGWLTGAVSLAGGARHSLAVLRDGRVVAWGANDQGQLGDGTTRASDVPVEVLAPHGGGPLRGAVAVAADTDFSMALTRAGRVVTWGRGDAGQRGTGGAPPPSLPNFVLNEQGKAPLSGVTRIAADGRSELALLAEGSVVAWGNNSHGELGDGTRTGRGLPAPVLGLGGRGRLADVIRIAIGGQNGLAVLGDGRVAAWGANDQGQLGDGTTTDRPVPGLVAGLGGRGHLDTARGVSAAEKHAYAVLTDGTVAAWGANGAGQLGDGTTRQRTTPVRVVGADDAFLAHVRKVVAGEAYGVAVMHDGTVLSWGANAKGQLGSGSGAPRDQPGSVLLPLGQSVRVVAVGAGERHLLLAPRP